MTKKSRLLQVRVLYDDVFNVLFLKCFFFFSCLRNVTENPSVVSVFENRERKLHTTRSWSFLGVDNGRGIPHNSIWKASKFGEDVIIGNLDTGLLSSSSSFFFFFF